MNPQQPQSSSHSFAATVSTIATTSTTNQQQQQQQQQQQWMNNNGRVTSGNSLDHIFSPAAWWRNYGTTNSSSTSSFHNAHHQHEEEQYHNHINYSISTNNTNTSSIVVTCPYNQFPNHHSMIIHEDQDSNGDWESLFAQSNSQHVHQDVHEPRIVSYPQQPQSSCKITINPTCTEYSNFECDNGNQQKTMTDDSSNLDGMITLLNRILIMNGVNPTFTNTSSCQTSLPQPNLEIIPSSFARNEEKACNFSYIPLQSFDETQKTIVQSSSISSSSSSSDSDSHRSSNSVIGNSKICKKRSTTNVTATTIDRKPRLKFQKEIDNSLKFNLVTSEELAASLLFHETSIPKKRNRGRPKKSESSQSSPQKPQKPKNDQQSIEFMVNCYDQCSKIFK